MKKAAKFHSKSMQKDFKEERRRETMKKAAENLLFVIIFSLASLSIQASGATLTWSGGDGDWDNDARWGGTQPVSGDQAQVNNGNKVTVNLAGEIASRLNLSNGSTVNANAGSLTLNAVSNTASLSINNSSLNVAGGAVVVSGVVNNFLQNSGVINVSAGSLSHTATNLRFGDGPSTGTLTVSGSGQWTSGSLIIVGTGNINLTGSSAQISGVAIANTAAGAALTFNLTPDSGGINAIGATNVNLTQTDTLNFNTDGYLGARTVQLFNYSGTLTSTFDTTNITRTGVGSLLLGSNPLGNPASLGANEYYLDYGDGSNDSITLYYNAVAVPEPSTLALLIGGGAMLFGMRRRIQHPFGSSGSSVPREL